MFLVVGHWYKRQILSVERLANVSSKEGCMVPSTTSKKDLGVVTPLVTAEREQASFFCQEGYFFVRVRKVRIFLKKNNSKEYSTRKIWTINPWKISSQILQEKLSPFLQIKQKKKKSMFQMYTTLQLFLMSPWHFWIISTENRLHYIRGCWKVLGPTKKGIT